MHLPPFPGFSEAAFQFLRDLKQHNERDWFKPRKETYDDELLWPLRCLVQDVAMGAAQRGLPLAGDPKASIFRIYRDTRFSKNKLPYKTHVSAYLSPSGDKKDQGGLYVHVEPGNCFLAAGFWHLEGPELRRWRHHLADDPEAFREMDGALAEKGLTLNEDDTLKRMPRGFEDHADTPLAPILKLKSFTTSRRVPDAATMTPAFTDEVLLFAEDVQPLVRYGMQVG